MYNYLQTVDKPLQPVTGCFGPVESVDNSVAYPQGLWISLSCQDTDYHRVKANLTKSYAQLPQPYYGYGIIHKSDVDNGFIVQK